MVKRSHELARGPVRHSAPLLSHGDVLTFSFCPVHVRQHGYVVEIGPQPLADESRFGPRAQFEAASSRDNGVGSDNKKVV